MRNLLRRRSPRPGEDGAIAIIAALLVTSLLILAGFTVDFGQAYVSKRQLQTASDAAALAAAAAFIPYTGSCTDLAANPVALSAANAAVIKYRDANRPGASTLPTVTPVCSDGDKSLSVTVDMSGTTPAVFASLAGGSNQITTARTATATLSVPPSVIGLRPWAVCSTQEISRSPEQVVEVGYPANGHSPPSTCSTQIPGDWWRLQCPAGGGSNGDSVSNITNGCTNPVSVIPNQPTAAASNETFPQTLGAYLRNNCVLGSSSCLSSDTGSSLKNLAPAWNGLLGKNIVIPVFCDAPQCDAQTAVGPPDSRWPVYKLASVTVCGYYLGGVQSSDTLPADCQGSDSDGNAINPNGYAPSDFPDSKNDVKHNGFLLIFHNYISSGTTGPSVCALGDDNCDGGLRRVLLTK